MRAAAALRDTSGIEQIFFKGADFLVKELGSSLYQ